MRTRTIAGRMLTCVALCSGLAHAATLNVKGFRMATDAQGGYVLTSDDNGNGSWEPIPGGGAAPHTHFGESWSGSANHGLRVTTTKLGAAGLEGYATGGDGNGVYGESTGAGSVGVEGYASAASGWVFGVVGESPSTSGVGVWGHATAASGGTGVLGTVDSPNGYAGYFDGKCHATGDLSCDGTLHCGGSCSIVGNLSKGSGSFKIDHPLDPENQYLLHSFVESPDMMNIYNGNAVLDAKGEARVELPEWFEALNRDFRYQLTCIGGFAQVYIAEEIRGNRFSIAGGTPGMKVSWQVTGVRNDPYAKAYRIAVEQDKPPAERGTYLHAEAWGQPKEKSLARVRGSRARGLAARGQGAGKEAGLETLWHAAEHDR